MDLSGTKQPPWLWLHMAMQEGSTFATIHWRVREALVWLNDQRIGYHVTWQADSVPTIPGLCAAFFRLEFRLFFARDTDAVIFRLHHPEASQDGRQHDQPPPAR